MSTNKAPLTLISTAETAGVLLHLEIWGAELWILMHWVLGELSGFRKGNEFKQCVDLYEYLLHVEELHWQDKVNIVEGERGRKGTFSTFLSLNHTSRAVALCFDCGGSVIHSPFDSWHHPFHFVSLSFYFSPCPHPRTSCTRSTPHSPTLDPHGCFGWVSDAASGHTLRTWAPFQNRLMGNVSLGTNGW